VTPAILPTASSQELDDCFLRTCRDRRSAVAIQALTDGRSITFGDVYDQYAAIVRAFEQLHIPRGAPVVTRVGNHPTFFPLVAASMAAGLALVALGEATDEETAAVITRCGAVAVVTDKPLPIAVANRAAMGHGLDIVTTGPRRHAAVYGESVVLKLTSGSTDVPKAAIASARHLVNDGRHIIDAMGIGADDINLACLPLSHSYALGNIVMPLLLQGTAVALRQSFNPLQFINDVEATAATVFPGVPVMFDRFRALAFTRLPPRLRLLITAGARVDAATVAWVHQHLGRKVHSFYGSSETGGITYDDSDDLTDSSHVGRPLPDTRVEIRDPDAAGSGRIFVTGTAVARAYAGAASGHAVDGVVDGFVDDGFLTSDVGRFDDHGRLVMTGRVSMTVNVAGKKVDPAEVERVLTELPGVSAARVIGIACDHRGQQLVAFVVSATEWSAVSLRRECARLLSPHKIPRRFIFLDAFPIDARGKMDRRALEALAAATTL
jgi:long-chain acyl-CoA synthetase